MLDLGCEVLGINIEELEGTNARTNAHEAATVRAFWSELVADSPDGWTTIVRWVATCDTGSLDDPQPDASMSVTPPTIQDPRSMIISGEFLSETHESTSWFHWCCGNIRRGPLHDRTTRPTALREDDLPSSGHLIELADGDDAGKVVDEVIRLETKHVHRRFARVQLRA